MKYKKASQLIFNNEKTYENWKSFTREMKGRGININDTTTYVIEDFLSRLEKDRQGVLEKMAETLGRKILS